ncbi:GAF domain-containing protein [Paracraurococcus ruber]|uniref:Diguanylate cyclase n=1 Tax=Paracraurococcus ruber TaxID=77675 RepID=A0ABS1CR62_9PROT|nr:GAF domain-containing protein [Paracraurococcus ruber]MBK1656676.1 diguanylate cyclase [Paracraurococcus ruber]TDG33705.1 GAF domain-containing protein [Paracraurococcus ruber]
MPAPIPITEAERLSELRSYAILDTTAEAMFDRVVELAAALTDCPVALISLVDAKRQWFLARHGLDLAETPRDHAFCAHAILNPTEPLLVEDAAKDDRFGANPLVCGEPGIRFYAGMPVVSPEGRALGTLCVIDRKPRGLDDRQRESLVNLALLAGTLLDLRRTARRGRVRVA